MDEICKRSARFVMTCLFSPSNLVQSVAYCSVKFAGYNSPLGSNALFCCQRYGFDLELFRLHSVSLDNKFFINWYKARVTEVEAVNAMSLIELLLVRDGHFSLGYQISATLISWTLLIALPPLNHYTMCCTALRTLHYCICIVCFCTLSTTIKIIIIIIIIHIS